MPRALSSKDTIRIGKENSRKCSRLDAVQIKTKVEEGYAVTEGERDEHPLGQGHGLAPKGSAQRTRTLRDAADVIDLPLHGWWRHPIRVSLIRWERRWPLDAAVHFQSHLANQAHNVFADRRPIGLPQPADSDLTIIGYERLSGFSEEVSGLGMRFRRLQQTSTQHTSDYCMTSPWLLLEHRQSALGH